MHGNRSRLYRTLGAGVAAVLALGTMSVASPAQAGSDLTGYIMPGNCQVALEPTPEEVVAYGVPSGTPGVSTRVLWAAPTDLTYFENCLPQGYEFGGVTWVNVSSPFTLGDCVEEVAHYCFWLVVPVNGNRVWYHKVFSGPAGPKPPPPPPGPPAPPGLPPGDEPGTSAPATGWLDNVSGDEIVGWAYDPDFTGPIQVQAYAKGKDGQWQFVGSDVADDPRDDIGRAAGFRIPHTLVGPATVYVYAIGVNSGGHTTGENQELQGNGKPVPKFDCGAGKFTLDDAKAFATAAQLPSGLDTFLADPCANLEKRVHHLWGNVVDAPAGDLVNTSTNCKIATDHFLLNAQLNRYWQVEVAQFDMVTYFCHDGQRVTGSGGGGIEPAAIQNVEIGEFGKLYQVAYQGIDDAGIVSGLATFNGNPEGAFFTSRPTSWTGGLPILSFFWSEQDSVTTTQVVFANGQSTSYFGTFGHPAS